VKVINETDKLQCLSSALLLCNFVGNKLEPFPFRKRVDMMVLKVELSTLRTCSIKICHFYVFHLQMTVVDIAVPMLNAFWDIAFVKRVSMEMERHAKVSEAVKVNSRYTGFIMNSQT